MQNNIHDINEHELAIRHQIDETIAGFTKGLEINNQRDFEQNISTLIDAIFENFKDRYERINDHERYKTIYLNAIRFKQDELLHNANFINVLSEVNDLHGYSDKKLTTYLDTILQYCKNKGRNDPIDTISYLVRLKSLLALTHKINGYNIKVNYDGHDIVESELKKTLPEQKKHTTMTNEQKNTIFKFLMDNEDVGTIDGKDIAKDLGVNVKHVMNLIEDFESKGYIQYLGMAGYTFQVTVKLSGIEFYDGGGFYKSESLSDINSNTPVPKKKQRANTSQNKPYVFIGSSTEGLEVAEAIQAELSPVSECHIWSQGLFGLSSGTLETLVASLSKFDFAILALTNDDITISREKEYNTPRDNVLLELGMFIGSIGKDRTFMVVDKSAKIKLPSDLAGITPALFEPPNKGTMRSAVGPACYEIKEAFKKHWRMDIAPNTDTVPDKTNGINTFEKDKQIITNYLTANGYTIISYERLFDMNPRFTKEYILSLVDSFSDYFRYAVAKGGKSGIALNKFII